MGVKNNFKKTVVSDNLVLSYLLMHTVY